MKLVEIMPIIQNRSACQEFRIEPVSSEILMQLIDAGRSAASCQEEQPWRFLVVTDASLIRQFAKLTEVPVSASKVAACIAVFCEDTAKCALEDGAAATQNILLAAQACNLGAIWMACSRTSDWQAISKLVHAPSSFRFVALVGVGFPASEIPQRKLRALSEIMYWQHF